MKPEFWMGRMVYFPEDVDPLIEQKDKHLVATVKAVTEEKDKEIERLLNCEDQSIKRGQEVIRLGRRISELEAENARLRELVEIYVPKTEVPK